MSLDELLTQLQYSAEIEQAVRSRLCKDGKQVALIAQSAYQGEDFVFPLCYRRPLTRLAVVTYLLLGKYGDYKAHGISDTVIFDTFRDVSLRAELYYVNTGKIGLTRDDVIWFRHIMNVGIFKIGSLQYQPFQMVYLDEETMGEPYMVFM